MGVRAGEDPAVFQIVVFPFQPVQIFHIFQFCTGKGAVRRNCSQIGDQAGRGLVKMGRKTDAAKGVSQLSRFIKRDVCGADQKFIQGSGYFVIFIYDQLRAEDFRAVSYGKKMLIHIGVKGEGATKGGKQEKDYYILDCPLL